jgi:peroxiredoxin
VQPGDPVPNVIVYDQDVQPVDIADLAQDGPYLLSFYLYDWTGT